MDKIMAALESPTGKRIGDVACVALDMALIRIGMQRGGLWLLLGALGAFDMVTRLNEIGQPSGVHHPRCPNKPADVESAPAAAAPDAPPEGALAAT